MAGSIVVSGFQVVLVFMFSVAFAIVPTMGTPLTGSGGAVTVDSHNDMIKSRHMSPFVRRNLEAGLNTSAARTSARGQSGLAFSSRSYQHVMITSGSARPRRLAGTANCSTSPGFCNSTSFPAGSSCCASTGICVDLMTDKSNCGICSYSCASSLACCLGTCVSIMTDNMNCGTCGTTCQHSLCSNGFCGYGG